MGEVNCWNVQVQGTDSTRATRPVRKTKQGGWRKSGGGIQGQVTSKPKSSRDPQVDSLGVEKGRTGDLRQTVWILGARKTTRLSEPLWRLTEGRKGVQEFKSFRSSCDVGGTQWRPSTQEEPRPRLVTRLVDGEALTGHRLLDIWQ